MGADQTKFPRSKKARGEFFMLRGGVCGITARKIVPGDHWDIDHIVAREKFHPSDRHKADHWDNLQLALKEAHRGADSKTSKDQTEIAKGDRVREKFISAPKERPEIVTRPPTKKYPRGYRYNRITREVVWPRDAE